MNKAVKSKRFSAYHYEAAIAAEHLKASSFENTNWEEILRWYNQLYKLKTSPLTLLNMAVVHLQIGNLKNAKDLLIKINPEDLEQRAYLYYGTQAEYYIEKEEPQKAINSLNAALELVNNDSEKNYLLKKKALIK